MPLEIVVITEASRILKCLLSFSQLNLNYHMHDCMGPGHQPGRTLLQTCCCL